MTLYIQALKKIKEGKNYTIPRNGTDDYSGVMQIRRTVTLQNERPKKEPKLKRERKKKSSLP